MMHSVYSIKIVWAVLCNIHSVAIQLLSSWLNHGNKSCGIGFLLGVTVLQQLIFIFVRLSNKPDSDKTIIYIV